MSRPSFVALGAAVACLWLVSPAGLAAPSEASGFDCQQLAEREEPTTPAEWLERSFWAGHCYIFQARAVRISSEGVRTLALSHDIHEGVEREVASYLDGPAVVYERHGRIGHGGGAVANGSDATAGNHPASPSALISRIKQHYRLSLEGGQRIAGRRSVRIDIEPRDNLRYGHRLWLDRETALPLKQVLIDIDGRILETFQMTELAEPRLYDDTVAFEPWHEIPPDPWVPGWLPAGYMPMPLPISSVTDTPLSHRLYSDGLSSFSVFIEPLTDKDRALRPGIHRLGVSHAAVRHLRLGERLMQVVVMGEMPPQVLGRIAARLEYRPERRSVTGTTP